MCEFDSREALRKTNNILYGRLFPLAKRITDEVYDEIARCAQAGYTFAKLDYAVLRNQICQNDEDFEVFDTNGLGLKFIMTNLRYNGFRTNQIGNDISIIW